MWFMWSFMSKAHFVNRSKSLDSTQKKIMAHEIRVQFIDIAEKMRECV